jgi:ech hydrogenase subunit A
MPRVAVMMLIGMAGMSLAPFGMLISKWAALRAVVDASPLLSFFIVFGSAATLFFWVKWMGKLVEVVHAQNRLVSEISIDESVALYGLSVVTLLACVFFPVFSTLFIDPYVLSVYHQSASLGQSNLLILMVLMALVMLFPFSFLSHGRGVKLVDPYLGGANTHGSASFAGSGGAVENIAMHNYYLAGILNEAWLTRFAVVGGALLLAAMLMFAFL